MQLATSEKNLTPDRDPGPPITLRPHRDRGIRPAVGFSHPAKVLKDPQLTFKERRAGHGPRPSFLSAKAIHGVIKMRCLLALALPIAIAAAGVATAQPSGATNPGTGCAELARRAVFPAPLRAGLILSDVNGNTLGKIAGVQASDDGSVREVQYTDAAGKAQTVDPLDLSFSGGEVVIFKHTEAPRSCAGAARKVTFPAPLHAGIIVSDVKGMTLGTIGRVQAGPDGAVTDVQYVDGAGATHTANPANLSYSGGEVAILTQTS